MARKNRLIDVSYLYLRNEYARILWFGRVKKKAGPTGSATIQVFWAPVTVIPEDKSKDNCPIVDGASIRETEALIGDMAKLSLNALLFEGRFQDPWKNGKLPFETRTVRPVTLDFTRPNLRLINRRSLDTNGDQIIPLKTDRLQLLEGADSKCLSVKVDEDPYAVIIPCVEIMRFFYCSSSPLANALFDGSIHNLSRELYETNPEKTYGPTEDGHVQLTLGKKMLDKDALSIAYLFVNKDGPALRNAQAISSEVMTKEGNARDVVAYPPFESAERLEFIFVSLPNNRKLVTRIIKSHHSLGFQSLDFLREDAPPTQVPKPTGGSTFISGPIDPESEDNSAVNLTNGDAADGQIPDEVELGTVEERFPAFTQCQIRKLSSRPTREKGQASRFVHIKTEHETHSTSRGNDDKRHGAVNLVRNGDVQTEAPDTSLNIGQPEYTLTASYLKTAKKAGLIDYEYVEGVFTGFKKLQEKESEDPVYFNVYPDPGKGHINPFEFLDSQRKILRMVLIAKVSKKNRTRFLIDFQQQPQEVAYQVFWFKDEEVPDNYLHLLNCALIAFAFTRSTKTANGHINVKGMLTSYFKHRRKAKSEAEMVDDTNKQKKTANKKKPKTEDEAQADAAHWIVDQIFSAKKKNSSIEHSE